MCGCGIQHDHDEVKDEIEDVKEDAVVEALADYLLLAAFDEFERKMGRPHVLKELLAAAS